jgi:Ca2+-binding RTX toxin-like protein
MATIGEYYYNYRYATTLTGTAEGDTINGYGGDDTLYGGLGDDYMYGGSGNDFLSPTDGGSTTKNWGNDHVYGGPGDDLIYFLNNTASTYLYGDEGNDTIYAGPAHDLIRGGNGNDVLVGGGGGDNMFGDAGIDELWGGDGQDFLSGGADGDWLHGGADADHFMFTPGNSGLTWETADTVRDFVMGQDVIDAPVAGSTWNYTEKPIAFNSGFDAAKQWAQTQINGMVKYAFATDGVNGYLFGDLDSNGWIDSGLELEGLTHVSQFNAWNIV